MIPLFSITRVKDITEIHELCQRCKSEIIYNNDSYYDDFFYGECTCMNRRKYKYIHISIELVEIKNPTECTYNITIYLSNEEIDIYNIDIDPLIIFSIYRSMDDSDTSMREILLANQEYFSYNSPFDVPDRKFNGVKPRESYIKEFWSLYDHILNTKPQIQEKKVNPHVGKKRTK